MALKQASLFDFVPEPESAVPEKPLAQEPPAENVLQEEQLPQATGLQKPAPEQISIEETIIEPIDESIREVEFVATTKIKLPKERKSTRGRLRLSDLHVNADLIEVPEDAELFQKSYYSIGAVSEMFKVNISLIRFWENEFDILKPKKNGKGDRLFRPEDVKNLKMIYHLLREKKYTIEGAKDFLKRHKKAEENFAVIEALKKLKLFLNELKANF